MIIENNRKFINLIIVLSIILLSKSIFFLAYGANFLLIIFFFILIIYLKIINFNFYLNKKIIIYSLLMAILILLNQYTNYTTFLVLVLRIIICLIVIELITFKEFSEIFSKIILLITFFSLFYVIVIFYNIPSFLPEIKLEGNRSFRVFIFFVTEEIFIVTDKFRNSGLWWEPGAYQIFINIAFLFSIINKSLTKKHYLIYLLGVVSTQSTTGFIAFILLNILYLKNNISINKLSFILLLIPFLAYFLLPEIFSKFDSTSTTYTSFSARYYDLLLSLNILKENIFFGYGFGSYNEIADPFARRLFGSYIMQILGISGADGITGIIAATGIFMILFLYPFFFPKYLQNLSEIDRLIVAITFLILFNTQNLSYTLIFTLLTFYGIKDYQRQKIGK